MTKVEFYGYGLPDVEQHELPGKLVVLEGTDGVGRSTQVALLREWLESSGYAVASSGLKRSRLAGKGISLAQEGHYLGDATSSLFYATDLADRIEREMIPALRAGFVVLTDRYIYSLIAPRPLQCQNGLKEPKSQFYVPLARKAAEEIRTIYIDFERPENFTLDVHPGAHEIDLPALLYFFHKHLQP